MHAQTAFTLGSAATWVTTITIFGILLFTELEMTLEEVWGKIKGKKNVIGYSKKLRKRIKDGREVDEEVIRIYVSKKVDPAALDLRDLIPHEIDGIPTDVV